MKLAVQISSKTSVCLTWRTFREGSRVAGTHPRPKRPPHRLTPGRPPVRSAHPAARPRGRRVGRAVAPFTPRSRGIRHDRTKAGARPSPCEPQAPTARRCPSTSAWAVGVPTRSEPARRTSKGAPSIRVRTAPVSVHSSAPAATSQGWSRAQPRRTQYSARLFRFESLAAVLNPRLSASTKTINDTS